MIEMKELQAFVVCADVHSFSRAAEILYTSQPNVSKMIRNLEKKLGFDVFFRDNKGIRLTNKGRRAYEYASRIVGEEENLSHMLQMDCREEFCVAFNPSSWIAKFLTDYYRYSRKKSIRYCFLEGSVSDIIERVGDGKAEIGLLFFRKEQRSGITYKMQRQGLGFDELKRVPMWMYFGRHYREGQNADTELIQCYEDEFALNHYWDRSTDGEDQTLTGRVSVLTNSDYVMNRMLRETDLCNMSARDIEEKPEFDGCAVESGTEEVIFGYVFREGDEPSANAEEMLRMLKDRLRA